MLVASRGKGGNGGGGGQGRGVCCIIKYYVDKEESLVMVENIKGEERTVLICSSKICQIRHVADDF